MNKKSVLLLIVILAALLCSPAMSSADDRPIQLSLVSPVQIFPEDYSIAGIRLSLIYGRNASVTGLDWGLINHTTTGLSQGVQFGLVGLADGGFKGWQNTAFNITRSDFEGFQWGIVNYADYASGFQLGFVNYARSMKGLQIGLVNIISKGGQFPVFPLVNWSF